MSSFLEIGHHPGFACACLALLGKEGIFLRCGITTADSGINLTCPTSSADYRYNKLVLTEDAFWV